MAPKKGPPPKGQRSITAFFGGGASANGSGSAAASDSNEGPLSPPPKRHRTESSTHPTQRKAQKQGTGALPPAAEHQEPPPQQQQQESSRGAAGAPRPSSPTPTEPAAQPRAPVRLRASDPAQARQVLQQKLALVGERRSAAAGAGAAQPIEPPLLSASGRDGQAGAAAATGGQKLTPLEQQVVALKRQHPGILLCVEVGYKFKFFGADAEVAARELGVYAFQDRAFLTAGFPVPRLHVHVRRLVQAGHKVGVVRQVETAAIKKAGDNKSGPFERRLTALYTKATLEAGELGGLDEEAEEEADEGAHGQAATAAAETSTAAAEKQAAPDSPRRDAAAPRRRWQRPQQQQQPASSSSYLACCVEEPARGGNGGGPQAVDVGLVAVEPSTGAVLHAQFKDGLMRSELESKLLYAAPAELLLAEPASTHTRRLLASIGEQLGIAPRLETVSAAKYSLPGSAVDAVTAFYGRHQQTANGSGNGATTATAAATGSPEGGGRGGSDGGSGSGDGESPAAALEAVRGLPPLVLRALAHLLDYLRPFGLESVLRLGASFQPWDTAQEMRLSANTLRQLEIYQTGEGGPKGSLFSVMDHTKTAFGRRLLHSWVGKPLRQRSAILARLDAVQELVEQGGSHLVLSRLTATLRTLPDLERGITRAFHATIRPADLAALLQHFAGLRGQLGLERGVVADGAATAGGSSCVAVATGAGDASPSRPDAGNDDEIYDEVAVGATAGASATEPPPVLRGVRSYLLCQLLGAAADPTVAAAARRMLDCLEPQAAAANDKANALRPSERFPEVLRWRQEGEEAEAALQGLLPQYRRILQISNLQFMTLQNQGEYLVEVPNELLKRVPKDWEKVSSVKKGVRYHPPDVRAGLQRLALAREHLKAACEAAWRQFLSDFGAHYPQFRAAVRALASLDCLCGLATLASSAGYCRPELADECDPSQLHIEAGRHPALELMLEGRGQQFVPNDTHLQGDGMRCQIITGPNMGGKSCYSRQCALIAMMAQVGSYVPAAAAKLRPLDGVYTRMGASDSLALGRSTFAEELGETSSILSAATPSSLVILDELGRGTSTGEGAAIAEATLHYVVQRLKPLTLFITHYPEVCFRLQQALPRAVACYRMAHVEEEGRVNEAGQQESERPKQQLLQQQQPQDGKEYEQQEQQHHELRERQAAALGRVVFLFKLVEGVAPASFGINVARMAQLPQSVLVRAAEVAARVQQEAEQRRGQRADQAAETVAATAVGAGNGRQQDGSSNQQLVQLAHRCRQFLQQSTAQAGPLDVEEGLQLQQQAHQLLSGGWQPTTDA